MICLTEFFQSWLDLQIVVIESMVSASMSLMLQEWGHDFFVRGHFFQLFACAALM